NRQYCGLRTIYGSNDGSSNGVYRSFDAGDTWEKVSGPWGTVSNDGNPIHLALSLSDSNVAFACISGQSLWRSTEGWAPGPPWTQLPLPPAEPNISLIASDATNSSVLFAGGVGLYKITGTNWSTNTFGTHVDQHAFCWAGNKLLLGNDGGMW